MSNLAIPRSQVHRLAEACSDAGDAFQPTATRLIRRQRRLSRFFEQNMDEQYLRDLSELYNDFFFNYRDAPLLVAGSTHPGEERAALDALVEVERAGWAAAPRSSCARRSKARA